MEGLKNLDQKKRDLDAEYERFSKLYNTIGIVKEDYLTLLKASENFSSLLRRSDYVCLFDDPITLQKEKADIICHTNDVSYRYVDEDEVMFSFPQFPKKKSIFTNKEYLFTLANTLFKAVSEKHNITKKKDRIVVFEFEHSINNSSKESLDYDNVDVSVIINSLVNYFLIDDSPNCYSLFYTSKNITLGKEYKKKTNVYLLSKQKFQSKQWLAG